MIVENFKGGDPVRVYRRLRDSGRLLPEGVHFVGSWVEEELSYCFQLMETEDRRLLDEWIDNWSDLIDFEVHPVVSSEEALKAVSPRL